MKKHTPSFVPLLVLALFFGTLCLNESRLCADVSLPDIFSSNMVLQRNMPVPVWGVADPSEKITVSFGSQTKTAEAGADGKWMVKLDALEANASPQKLIVKGNNEITIDNVLVGEVWLCSGQSNMEWSMTASADSREQIPSINEPNIRLFHVGKAWNQSPQNKLQATWKLCDPESVKSFSAVGYFFGKRLQDELNVPIGLINSSWGGTRIEPWTPPVGFEAIPALSNISESITAKNPNSDLHKELVGKAIQDIQTWSVTAKQNLAEQKPFVAPPVPSSLLTPPADHQQPIVLYNAMIFPFVPYAMQGAIWYQGESNSSEGMLYAEKMKALISGWRKVFNNDRFGFYFVQLAPYNYGGGSGNENLPKLWEAQASVDKNFDQVGMAVINDIGNVKDIHPDKKNIVGNRLALLALNRSYDKTDVVCASPAYDSFSVDGKTMIVNFKNAKTLKTRDGKSPDWFEIAGADGSYLPATATIDGTTVRLTNSEVDAPFVVRFAWNQLAEPNLQNEAGLQASAFRAGTIPERGKFDVLVPNCKQYQVVYNFDPSRPVLLNDRTKFEYRTDKSSDLVGKVKRVGYFLMLKAKDAPEQFIFVTTPPISQELNKLGVPVKSTGVRWQQNISDVTVASNVPGIETGSFADGCNIEFWECNYAAPNKANVPGASGEKFDFGDEMTSNVSPGYGSMQIHNFAKKQTLFAFNNFGAGNNCDLGIGNCPTGDNTDWTFRANAASYEKAQFMILVEME
ncbi:MAG: sialate O-acetylesterase [Thermoguttaceae bacterium]